MLVRTSGNTLLVGTGQYTAFVGTSLFSGASADTLLMGTGQYKHFQTDLIYDDVLMVAILVNLLAKPLG